MPAFRTVLLAIASLGFSAQLAGAADEPALGLVDLRPRIGASDLAQVTIELTEGGTTQVPLPDTKNTKTKDLPFSVSATLKYDEHRFAPTQGDITQGDITQGDIVTRAVRYFDKAEATIQVDAESTSPTLSDDRRLIVADAQGGRVVLTSPRGPLAREELDLVEVAGDSLVVDRLLPKEPVAADATWNDDPAVMAALLDVDSVASCEVSSTLDKFNADFALVRIAGSVVGAVDGAATELQIRGVYLFDRKIHRVTKLNLAIKEKRSVGGATRGLDSVAKLRLTVLPIESSEGLTPAAIATIPPTATAATSTGKRRIDLLLYNAERQGFRILHDRGWYVTTKEREATTLRRVDQGDVVAQCTITSLPAKAAGRQTTLEEFEKDIRFALRENFGELVSSREWTNAYHHSCLEVVLRGKVEDVPVEWHYYLVAPESGPRVSVAVTIEGPMVERLAGADRTLVNGIQLAPPQSKLAGKETDRR